MHLHAAMWLIKLGTAVTMIAFGWNQAHYPEKWLHFMPQVLRKSTKMKPTDMMRTHALGNIVLGIFLVFPFYTWLSSIIALVWWLSIVPLAWKVDWHTGLRDLTISFGLAALVALSF